MSRHRNRLITPLCRPSAGRRDFLLHYMRQEGIPFEILQDRDLTFFLIRPSLAPRPTQRYLKTLTAHYDTVQGTPGANDNTSAIVQLLSLAQRLSHNREQAPPDVEILLTDGEELQGDSSPSKQGIYRMAPSLPDLNRRLFLVFDMTGIGDTVILGEAGEELLSRQKRAPLLRQTGKETARRYLRDRIEDLLLRIHNGRFFHLSTLFSDDLGLLLLGLPVIQISLMPFEEALTLKASSQAPKLPPSWQNNHTPGDSPATLEDRSFALMESLLDRLTAYIFPYPLPREKPRPAPVAAPLQTPHLETRPGPYGIRTAFHLIRPAGLSSPSLSSPALLLRSISPPPNTKPLTASQYSQYRQWVLRLAREKGASALLLSASALKESPAPLSSWLQADAERKPRTPEGGIILWKSLRPSS